MSMGQVTAIDRYPFEPASDVTCKAERAHGDEHQHQQSRDEKLRVHAQLQF
jgi:hypothetical protein